MDGDDLYYDLYISQDSEPLDLGPFPDTLFSALSDSFFNFNGNNFLRSNKTYSWWVLVYDTFDTLSSDTFNFKTPTVTNISDFQTMPTAYKLYPNIPNPFNSSTKILYDVKESGKVKVQIYNILGQEIITLVNEEQTPGRKSVTWDGRDKFSRNISSGIYFYTPEAGNYIKTRKLVLVK